MLHRSSKELKMKLKLAVNHTKDWLINVIKQQMMVKTKQDTIKLRRLVFL